MHNPEIENALGAAHSFLHALKMATESCEALGGGGRDYCAFQLLIETAQTEISNALDALDRIGERGKC